MSGVKRSSSLDGARLLFVDDEKDFLSMMVDYFPSETKTLTASNAIDAFRILKTESIDVVFCDIQLGQTDGLELLKKCRSENINVPFIMMSGHINKERLLKAIRTGAVDVLEKPINFEYLNKHIDEIVQSGRSIQKIKKDFDSVVSIVNPADPGSVNFVEDYLAHVQVYKTKKTG